MKNFLKIFVFLFFVFGFFLLFFSANKSYAITQCAAEGGACTSVGICNANCGTCTNSDNYGYNLCGAAQICCDGSGQTPTCNAPPLDPLVHGGASVECVSCGFNYEDDTWNGYANPGTIACIGPATGYDNGQNISGPCYDVYGSSGGSCLHPGNQCGGGIPGNPAGCQCAFCSSRVCYYNNSCGACSVTNNLGVNHCGTVSGTEACKYQSPSPCTGGNNTVDCNHFYDNCQNPFACVNGDTCEKTMGGRVTDTDTGNGIDGVVITGGGTTAGGGYWTHTNMAYNSAFTFTAPSGAGSNPCNNGYECGSASPNPANYTGTVGGGGDCGMNCNFTYTPGKISGTVYVDSDHDGAWDHGETAAFAGILVQDTAGDYTYTDANGNYTLNYLNTQTYTVYVHNFQGYKTITSSQTLAVPPNRVGINFGITPAYSVSGYVFTDWNYNNNFDAEDNSYIPPPAVNVVNTAATVPVISDVPLTLNNPSFETGGTPPSGWNFYVTAPAAGTVSQDCTTSSNGTCSAHVNISASDPANFWYLNLLQPTIPLNQDTAYKVSFDAKASAARPIYIFLQEVAAPWIGYGGYHPTLTTAWKSYSFVFTSDYTDAAANLEFEFAEATGDVWIDNVSIRPMSYTVPKLYNGSYNQTLSPMPPNTKQSPPVPNPVTVNGADVTYENLGISPLYRIQGNVYIDANKSACWEPAYDPLYSGGGTVVSLLDSLGNNPGGTGTTTYSVTNGLYNTGITLHAGTYTATYAAPTPYQNYYPPVGFSITVGHPGKSVSCDTTLAENVACW